MKRHTMVLEELVLGVGVGVVVVDSLGTKILD
jgi:hypothetical protein